MVRFESNALSYVGDYDRNIVTPFNRIFDGMDVLVIDQTSSADGNSHTWSPGERLAAWIDHGGSDADPNDIYVLEFGSRPINARSRARYAYIPSPNEDWYVNYTNQDCPDGWFSSDVVDSNGDERQVGVFNPDTNSWHTVNDLQVFANCEHYCGRALDDIGVFDDFIIAMKDEDWVANAAALREQRRRERFYEFMARGNHSQAERVEGLIQDTLRFIQNSENDISSYRNSLRDYQAQLTVLLDNDQGIDAEQCDRELAAIERHADVVSVTTAPESQEVIVQTRNILLPDPNGMAEDAILGEYEIRLDFANARVIAKNLTNRKGTYDHPHIHEGSFCTGNWGPTIRDLLTNRQIAAAVNFVIDTLGHVNANDDWGRSYRHWFTDDNNALAMENAQHS